MPIPPGHATMNLISPDRGSREAYLASAHQAQMQVQTRNRAGESEKGMPRAVA